MRLPWLQIDQDGLNRCRLLARLLGIPDTQGIGIGVSLWQWALEMAPEGDFTGLVPDSGILAAAVGWSVPDAGRLVSELQRVGMVATAPTLRVRGLDRYRRAWEKNTRGKRKPSSSGEPVPGTGRNPAPVTPEPAPQTQTQTHIEEKTVRTAKIDQPVAPPPKRNPRPCAIIDATAEPEAEPVPVVAGPVVYVPPTSDPSTWLAADFWAWAQAQRQGAGLLGERTQPRGLSAWWGTARLTTSSEALCEAFVRFCADPDPYWQKALPQWPFAGFMKQWDRFVPAAPVTRSPPRVDADVFAELRSRARELGAGGHVAEQLEQLRWERKGAGYVGVTEDGYHAQFLVEKFGPLLADLGATIDAPAVGGAA